jgi:Family of unknown function (DUF5947)
MTSEVQVGGVSDAFETLRQFARKQRPVERCELCGAELVPGHPHLIELAQRKVTCACDACAVLFSGQTGAKYKRVPRRVRMLTDFHLTDAQWDRLLIPINMAFFFRSSLDQRVIALYPSPAGATESLLALETWNDIVKENPELGQMETDVEALLVNRMGQNRAPVLADYFILPIDECYKLVGLIRTHWKGLSGGTEVWQEIGNFFAGLRNKAEVPSKRPNA